MRTDFVIEAAVKSKLKKEDYLKKSSNLKFGIKKNSIEISTKKVSALLSRDFGRYDSINASDDFYFSKEIKMYLIKTLKNLLLEFFEHMKLINAKSFLVVGLGNKDIVADSLGQKTAEKIFVTRHLQELGISNNFTANFKTVSSISTGVLGTTGIETYDITKGVVNAIKPDVVFLIDTLAANSVKRLAKSFQITDTGVFPGAGVNNHRKPLNKASLNVPVITVGVPFVVYASNIVEEVLGNREIGELDIERQEEIRELIVTVKDVDLAIRHCSDIIATSINWAINNKFSLKEILDYMN